MLSRHIETTELKQPVSGIPQNQHGYSQALGGEQQRLNMHDCLGFLCNKENIFQHPPEREREKSLVLFIHHYSFFMTMQTNPGMPLPLNELLKDCRHVSPNFSIEIHQFKKACLHNCTNIRKATRVTLLLQGFFKSATIC